MFDFLVLPEGRPNHFAALAALSGMTDRIGLVGTVDTTVNEPFEVSRQFATLDHISGGRAGWSIGVPPDRDQYRRTAEFVAVARAFWDSWAPDAVLADVGTGIYADPNRIVPVDFHGTHFDVRGVATLPAGPQGHPVLVAAADSEEGRQFGAEQADVLVTSEPSQRHYADVKARAAMHGRNPDRLKVFASYGQFTGSAADIVARIDHYVQSDACDGFVLTPHGLDGFVERVVPLLQERGVFRTGFRGRTLRENLGL